MKKWYEATPDDYGDPDDIYGTATAAGDDDLDTHHVPGDEYYDGEFDDDLIESVIILVLVAAVVILVYYRQQRQQNMARRQQGQGAAAAAAAAAAVGGRVGLQGFEGGWGVPH